VCVAAFAPPPVSGIYTCVRVHVFMFMCEYICMYVDACVCVREREKICLCGCLCPPLVRYTYMCTCACMYVYACVCMFVDVRVCV